jgi:hypothetical protein
MGDGGREGGREGGGGGGGGIGGGGGGGGGGGLVGGKKVMVRTTTGSVEGDVPGQRGSLRFVDPTGGREGGRAGGAEVWHIGRKPLHNAWRLTIPELKIMLKQGMKEAHAKEAARRKTEGEGRGWLGWWGGGGDRASHQHTSSGSILGAVTTAAAAATAATTATTAKKSSSSRHQQHCTHPDINAIDVTGSTPLMYFAEQGSIPHGECMLVFVIFASSFLSSLRM